MQPFVGRVSRAAVFAGLAACWTGKGATESPPPPPPAPRADAAVATGDELPGDEPPLRGVVRERGSQRPIYGAIVELLDANGKVASVNTEVDGSYVFEVPPGDYQLVVNVNDGSAVGSTQVPVSVREQPQNLVVDVPLLRRAPMPKPYGAPPARRSRIV